MWQQQARNQVTQGPGAIQVMNARMLLLGVVLLTCTPAPPSGPPPSPLGRVGQDTYVLEVSSDGRAWNLLRDGVGVVALDPYAVELGTLLQLNETLSYDPYWLENTRDPLQPEPPLDLRWETVTQAVLRNPGPEQLEVALSFTDGAVAALTAQATDSGRFRLQLRVEQEGPGSKVAFMRVGLGVDAQEGFYGLGEWPDAINHRGHRRPMQMEIDPSVESFNNENHAPVPLLIGTRGWGVFVESTLVGVFDVAAASPTRVAFAYGTGPTSLTQPLVFHLMAAEHPLDVLRHYHAVTAPARLPAPWALGPWIWRNENRDAAQVADDIRILRNLDLATSAIWLDRPYSTDVNTFDFNPTMFPDPAAMVADIHAHGLRLAAWHTPYVAPGAQPFHQQALDGGYFPPVTGTVLNGWSKPVDFTRPAALAWWQQNLRSLVNAGVEGFKLDYAEDVVPALYHARNEWRFFDGSDERTMHHGYTVAYHKAYADLLAEDGGFLLCRAARWGDQAQVSVIWPGDLDATFTQFKERFTTRGGDSVVGVGGLPASVMMGLGLSASGFPFFGADTGGYRHGPPGKELFIRWAQQAALSSVMQVGDSTSQTPWEFTAENGRDMETLAIYRVYARLHLRLFPYEWTYAQNMAATGRPITRPFGLAFPQSGAHPTDQYMFGDELLVAPVLVDGVRSRSVLLPPGNWVNWWTGEVLPGNRTVTVEAGLQTLPLLAQAGSVVPLLRPGIDTLSPATVADVESFANDAGRLFVRVFPGAAPHTFTVYDGSTVDHQDGVVSVTSGAVFAQGTVLEWVALPQPAGVMLDGAVLSQDGDPNAASGWRYTAETGGTVWVAIPAGSHTVTVQ